MGGFTIGDGQWFQQTTFAGNGGPVNVENAAGTLLWLALMNETNELKYHHAFQTKYIKLINFKLNFKQILPLNKGTSMSRSSVSPWGHMSVTNMSTSWLSNASSASIRGSARWMEVCRWRTLG